MLQLTRSRVWFSSTITGLYGLWLKQGTRRSENERKADALMHKKYLCDLVFVCESRSAPECTGVHATPHATLTRSI